MENGSFRTIWKLLAVAGTVGAVSALATADDGAKSTSLLNNNSVSQESKNTVSPLSRSLRDGVKNARTGKHAGPVKAEHTEGSSQRGGGLPCDEPFQNCQDPDLANAFNATAFITQDDFTPASSGDISSLCFWGGYLPAPGPLPDDFTVTYYDDAGGFPGTILAQFSQSGGSLTVTGPVATGGTISGVTPENEYSATHAPVSVGAGNCYWVEISNAATGGSWFWSQSFGGNGRGLQNGAPIPDVAFCFDMALGDATICLPPPPENDNCEDAEVISGTGDFFFNNADATTDGLPHGTCLFFGADQIANDVWFRWTAPKDCDFVRIQTCNGTTMDSKLALYDDTGACPPGDFELLACNDDACGLQSRIETAVVPGNTYLIRLGNYPGAAGSSGTFNISCLEPPPPPPCDEPFQNCQDPNQINAYNSTAFITQDDFRPLMSGEVTSVCFWGAYLPGTADDDFTFTYYDNVDGLPGSIIAQFSQSGGTLDVIGPAPTGLSIAGGVAPEFEYLATHAPVSVTGGDCYWLEITNATAGASWFWETAFGGNSFLLQNGGPINDDAAFCLNLELDDPFTCLPPPPENDDCFNAEEISGEGTFSFDNAFASTDGLPHGACLFFGGDQIDNDVWYCWTAPSTGTYRIDTCGQTGVDTKIAVYNTCDVCPPSDNELIVCNDDACGLQSRVQFDAVGGQTYLVRLGTFPGASGGFGTFTVSAFVPATNDACEDAIPVQLNVPVSGDTTTASVDTGLNFCGTSGGTAPGVWYVIEGDGTTLSADTCAFAGYDTKIHVFCGTCDDLLCVGGNDDACGLQSRVTWCSQVGATYYILVHGFSTAAGSFELLVTSDGVPCTATVECLPQGACCVGTECFVTTQDDCVGQGGTYLGDGTNCGDVVSYVFSTCDDGFEDISGTYTTLPAVDDGGAIVPLGFSFEFFGNVYTDVGTGSNGYLTFDGAPLGDFSPDPIPNTATPNNLIAPLWTDLNPGAGGSWGYQTVGTAPNRRFIVQWTNVPRFGGTGSHTFQAVLHEGSNEIQFRYGNLDFGSGGARTIGVENATGTEGTATTQTPSNGTCYSFAAPPPSGNPCEDDCAPDWNNDGVLNSEDFFAFLQDFFAGNADYNNSGSTTSEDFFAFLSDFFAGC